eukprot:1608004-Amphidinium_carterae.1
MWAVIAPDKGVKIDRASGHKAPNNNNNNNNNLFREGRPGPCAICWQALVISLQSTMRPEAHRLDAHPN